MVIIADSGSTKCDWLILNSNYEITNHVTTNGYNPYFHDHLFVAGDLKANAFFLENGALVEELYFYGAGCSSPSMCKIIEKGLSLVFPNAEISIDHDLMASALATYRGEDVISCILGTGSNSCYFNGAKLRDGNPPLGYVVGDEGSGAFFGKQLLNDYFYGNLPLEIHEAFSNEFNLNRERFTKAVYDSAKANVYLASFMTFLASKREHPYVQDLIGKGFKLFIEKHVCCFENHLEVQVSFVGSIAYFFQEELEVAAKQFNLSIGEFVHKPVFKLVDYHKANVQLKIR